MALGYRFEVWSDASMFLEERKNLEWTGPHRHPVSVPTYPFLVPTMVCCSSCLPLLAPKKIASFPLLMLLYSLSLESTSPAQPVPREALGCAGEYGLPPSR